MIKKLFSIWKDILVRNKDYLIELDSVAGDGDLGLSMTDGFLKIKETIDDSNETDIGSLFSLAGATLSDAAPSSMGTLLAMGFMNTGNSLQGKEEIDSEAVAILLESIAAGMEKFGGAKEGEKTFLDAIYPAARAARNQISGKISEQTKAAAEAARNGFNNTKDMIAKHGRIAFRGEESRGIEDPGAAVAMFLVIGLQDLFNE